MVSEQGFGVEVANGLDARMIVCFKLAVIQRHYQMKTDNFIAFLSSTENRRFGLCMFAPAVMAPAANRMLNEAYGDQGNNLSVPMGPKDCNNIVRYWAGNYSSASLEATIATIQTLSEIPGTVLLVAEAGIGVNQREALGLLENGQLRTYEGVRHSIVTFAENHLSVHRLEDPSDLIEEFHDLSIVISAEILAQNQPTQILLRTPWEAIFREIMEEPERLFRFKKDPRAFEEFIAETYRLDGYKVILTPRSNDGGVDVVAQKDGFGAIKILDQAKAYAKHRAVSANDVRAAFGVLSKSQDASKVVVTTTSDFAPGVYDEFSPFMPTRVELRHGQDLVKWLQDVYGKSL